MNRNTMRRLVMLVMILGAFATDSFAADKPNILFAIADDATWRHFGAYGCEFVETPNFDRVAKQGVLFKNCYTTNPKCSPSRATILTGRNTWELEDSCNHFGIFWNKFKVYPDLLEADGYHIGHTGKGWWPGDFQTGGFKRNPAGPVYNKAKLDPPTSSISKTDYTENFRTFLSERTTGQPFYFWYGGNEPHRSYEFGTGRKVGGKKLEDAEVPPYLPDEEIVREDILDYALEIEWFDKHLGQMLQMIEAAGELDNTLVVVTSDNGMPFPRVKGQIYDDDFHMPMAACWGKHIKGGRVVDDFISFSDLAPTFLEAAGIEPQHKITGRSFMDILRSENSGQIDPTRNFIVVGKERHDRGRPNMEGYPVRAIRNESFMYAVNFEPDRWPACDPPGFGNIDGSPTKRRIIEMHEQGNSMYWDFAMGKRPAEELYRIDRDSHCINNLANQPEYAETKAQLRNQMFELLKQQEDPRALGNGAVFDRFEYGSFNGKSKQRVEEASRKIGNRKPKGRQ
ncbi:Arylsulfatase [Planctomycetes bacterium CA13]|uniref:Arylsulfatase n=1 Tax=Novipirellula herctigrandis TaxID=2527986 RepID=A0A5C5ZAU8_9BACT|nr:Arylsulfatase [Planctomycetes bacterium CA13]